VTSTVVYLKHALTPSKREVKPFVGKSLTELAPHWARPYVCLVDGKPVLRKDWDLRIYRGQVVTFIDVQALPAGGGGGSNPVRMIAMLAVVALSIAAPYLAPAGWGLLTAEGAISIYGAIASAGVMLAGSALVNAVLPPTTQMANQQSLPQASPTYNLTAQGNTARIEQAIPEHFGRHIAYPDFASNPYQEFSGNDQFLYQLFVIGRGKYDIEAIRIEDTDISEFEDITYAVYGPHRSVSLFPSQVVSSVEVSGQAMPYNTYTGEFVANAAGTEANYLGFDFLFPRGLYHASSSGGINTATVTWTIEACEIDEDGDEVGSWTTLGNVSMTKGTVTPQRVSKKYAVTPGRYKGRVKRTNEEETGTTWAHEIVWAGLRAYLQDDGDYGDVTTLAMIMRASDQLTSVSARKVNVIATRKLPVWNGSGWSASPQQTRSIAWAAAYVAKQIGFVDAQIDLATLLQLDAVWASRGDTCNGRFDSTVTGWEALQRILRCGRAKPFLQGGIVRFFRDQANALQVYTFSMRDIRKGSFSVDYVMPSEMTADAVSATYFDSGVWRQKRVQASLPGSSAAQPAKVDFPLVTDRAQAFRESVYEAACNRYRRKIIKFQTEMKGFIPSFGDMILVQHDMPAWGQGGEAVAWDEVTNTLTCSEPLTWTPGETHYIAMNKTNGSMTGPYACVAGDNEYRVVILEALGPDFEPYTGDRFERTHYYFGWAATYGQYARVLQCIPRDERHVEIHAVNEDSTVHTAEDGLTVPTAPTSQLANYTAAPQVSGLIARSDPGDVTQMLLSWLPSPWAQYYLVEVSADGVAWTSLGSTTATNYAARAIYGSATIVRVAAVNTARGPWVSIQYGGAADYMWTDDAALMWDADDTTLMWS